MVDGLAKSRILRAMAAFGEQRAHRKTLEKTSGFWETINAD